MNITLTKRQAAMIMELMCPHCRNELTKLAKLLYHCYSCGMDYRGEQPSRSES